MPEIGAYEAKTHLPKLLARVAKGERFVITRHGTPVAELGPVTQRSRQEIEKAIQRLKDFQSEHSLGGISIEELIREGRKY